MQENGSRHRDFLRWIPLHSSPAALVGQRKVALYGVRARETPEDPNEREIRKEIRSLLAELFGGMCFHLNTSLDVHLIIRVCRRDSAHDYFHGWPRIEL